MCSKLFYWNYWLKFSPGITGKHFTGIENKFVYNNITMYKKLVV
jgi:hypothetical protein